MIKIDNSTGFQSKLLDEITVLKEKVDPKLAKYLNIDLLEKATNRLISFSEDCNECESLLNETEKMIDNLITKLDTPEQASIKDYRDYHLFFKKLLAHLQKRHKLVMEGAYMGLGMSLGVAFGLVFGVSFNNIALGIPLGLAIGIAIGAVMDDAVKKKGLVI